MLCFWLSLTIYNDTYIAKQCCASQDKLGGKAKEAMGSVTGDESKKNEGKAQNLSGKVRIFQSSRLAPQLDRQCSYLSLAAKH